MAVWLLSGQMEVHCREVQRAQYLYLFLYLFWQQIYLNKSRNRHNNPVFVFAIKAAKIYDVEE